MNIKKMISILFVIVAIKCFSQNKFELVVSLKEKYHPSKILLTNLAPPYTNYECNVIDTTTFSFSGNLNNIYNYFTLYINSGSKKNVFHFFLQKGKAKILINDLTNNDSANNITYINFPMINQQKYFWNSTRTLEFEVSKNYEILSKLYILPKLQRDKNKIDSIGALNKIFLNNILQKKVDFIKKYPNSLFSLFFYENDFLNENKFSYDTLKMIFHYFSNKLRNSNSTKAVQIKLKQLGSVQVGSILPNANFITYQDKKMNFADFKDKNYLLICFWASWCGPCVHSIPIVKEIYSNYNKLGLEIVSIAIDDPTEKWIAAMEKYSMPWLQTNCNEQYMPNEDVKKKYLIPHIPQYILIDKQGKVLYNRIQIESKETDEYTILNEVLKTIFNK